jgi:hypothetical protein
MGIYMDQLDKVRLAIYERTDLSHEDKRDLLILAEEKAEEVPEEAKRANKVYMDSYMEATKKCEKDIKEAKEYIKDEKYAQAEVKLKIAKNDLYKLDKIVEETPSTLSQTALSQCVNALINTVTTYSAEVLVDKLFNDQKKEMERVSKEYINNLDMSKEAKKTMNKSIEKSLGKPSLTDTAADSVTWELIKDLMKLIRGKDPVASGNKFKQLAHKKISKDIDKVADLEIKLRKLKENE